MKTAYITKGCNIVVDEEVKSVKRLDNQRTGIDYIYLAEEPMHVIYGYGEYNKEFDVEKGDIIVVFYPDVFKNKIVIIKNAEWLENLVEYNKECQEDKERWAASKLDTNTISRPQSKDN